MENKYYLKYEKLKEHYIKRINKEVSSQKNKKLILDFVKSLEDERRTTARQVKIMQTMLTINKKLGKDFDKATIDDIKRFCHKINGQTGNSERYRADLKSILKQFYKWHAGSDEYPELVRWIKGQQLQDNKKIKRKRPSDMLTENEKLKLIQGCTNVRDTALVSLWLETGVRPKEILLMKLKDIDIQKDITLVTIPEETKTGTRTIPIIASKPHLVEWLNQHPYKTNNDAWLWNNLRRKADESIAYDSFEKMLQRLKERVGIKKKIYGYVARHSSYTDKAKKGWTEQQIKLYHGLSPDSKVLSHYIHLSGVDLLDRVKKDNGLITEEKEIVPKFKVIECDNCRTENGAGAVRCKNCGMILDLKLAHETFNEQRQALAYSLFSDVLKKMDIKLDKEKLKSAFM